MKTGEFGKFRIMGKGRPSVKIDYLRWIKVVAAKFFNIGVATAAVPTYNRI